MTRRFDLIDLQLFLHVAEAASLTHGARKSHLSLAAASERVRAMEEVLGAPLLKRNRRGVELTPAGAVLVHHAHAVMQQMEQMRGELSDYAKGLRGRIRLMSNTIGLFEYLPTVLCSFLSAHPHVDVDMEERTSVQVIRAIGAGDADIGIIGGTVDPAAELETFPFAENRLVLAVPRGHPLSRYRRITFHIAMQFDFIGLGADSALQAYVDEKARRAGTRLKVRVRVSSFDLICQMVAAGIGIAVVPEVAARRWQRSMATRVVALADDWSVRHLTGCIKSLKSLSPHAGRLVELLRGQ